MQRRAFQEAVELESESSVASNARDVAAGPHAGVKGNHFAGVKQRHEARFVGDFWKRSDQCCGSGEAHAVAALASGQAESQREMGLVPLLPSNSTFSLRDRNSHRASARLADGMARKSKVSRVLTTGNFAYLLRSVPRAQQVAGKIHP